MIPDPHRACEARYRALLDRLEDMAERVERLERDQRSIIDLLRDFRELSRLLIARVRALDFRLEGIAARLVPSHARDERIARHFRN